MIRGKLIAGLLIVLTGGAVSLSSYGQGDFILHSVTDNSTFDLSKERGRFVALHFLLKTECPFCLRHTREYIDRADNLPDVRQVFIKPDTPAEIQEWASKFSSEELAEFPIYHDPDAMLAERFGIPGGYRFHGQTVHYPATILIGPDGKEVFRYIGKNNSDRLSFDQLTRTVKSLSTSLQ